MKRGALWSLLWLFLLGALIGATLDAIQVYRGIERYPAPVLFGLAWWTPLLFGCAAVAIGYSHAKIDTLLRHVRPRRRFLSAAGECIWLVLAYLVSISPADATGKALVLAIVYLNFWLWHGRSWQNLLLSFVTAITGVLVEIMLVAAGAFYYLHPDVLGVPVWLPFLYACASLAVGDVGRSLFIRSTEVFYETT